MKESDALMCSFLLRADEFYVLTRFSYQAFLQRMIFRMSHHALEYYIKAGLSQYLTEKRIKKLGHNVDSLWKEYETHVFIPGIDTRIISHINQFEKMRYPGESKCIGTLLGPPRIDGIFLVPHPFECEH